MIEIKALSLFEGNMQRSDKKADFWNSFTEQTHQFLYPSFICSKDHRQIKQNGNKETVITTVMHQSKKEQKLDKNILASCLTPPKSCHQSTNHSPLFHKKAFNVKTEVPESLLKQKSWVTHHKKEEDTEITANLKNSQKTVLTPN